MAVRLWAALALPLAVPCCLCGTLWSGNDLLSLITLVYFNHCLESQTEKKLWPNPFGLKRDKNTLCFYFY